MKQSTIREKIEKLLNQDGISYIESFKINFKTPKQNNIGGEMIMNPVFLKEFARLICQEMVETFTGVYGKDEMGYPGAVDWRPRATISLEQKAQEILKALE